MNPILELLSQVEPLVIASGIVAAFSPLLAHVETPERTRSRYGRLISTNILILVVPLALGALFVSLVYVYFPTYTSLITASFWMIVLAISAIIIGYFVILRDYIWPKPYLTQFEKVQSKDLEKVAKKAPRKRK